MNELFVSELWRFPIKSVGGERIEVAHINSYGIEGDREFALVDPDSNKVLSRKDPKNIKLAGVSACLINGLLIVDDGNFGGVQGEPIQGDADFHDLTLLNDRVSGIAQNRSFSEYFSDLLGKYVELVRISSDYTRPVEDHPLVPEGKQTSYSDGYPLTVVSAASLAAVGEQIGKPHDLNDQIRANIIIDGCDEPFFEDQLFQLVIGRVDLRLIKASTRCVMTEQGLTEEGQAKRLYPTLQALRRLGHFGYNGTSEKAKALLAQNAVSYGAGTISERDIVRIFSDWGGPNWSKTPIPE